MRILLLMAAGISGAAAQNLKTERTTEGSVDASVNSMQVTFKPSIAVVIGIFSIMFCLTFILLMYAKFCHSQSTDLFQGSSGPMGESSRLEEGRFSGIDKSAIESLPCFRFSALKGSREGLECSVCISRFDDAEVLRLLPRCKHAFHADCVDRWLEFHSSCPLCRSRVELEDAAFFKCDDAAELYVEREPDRGPSRSFRWAPKLGFKRGPPPLHNFRHRILVSEVVFRSRWSDFAASDLISLDSEMLRAMSSRRFDSDREELERRRRRLEQPSSGDLTALISPANRCVSDITQLRSNYRPSGSVEERAREKWLPIARRTVQLFAGKADPVGNV